MMKRMVILYDTREQDTPALHRRLEGFNCPSERQKLEYGDYSAKTVDDDGQTISMERQVAIERKMSLDELCQCFTSGRKRFEREFERAADDHAKIHMIVENGSYEDLFDGKYRSKMHPNALIASYIVWSIRYHIQLHFCKPETTGRLIYKILFYELKTFLENGGWDCHARLDQTGS